MPILANVYVTKGLAVKLRLYNQGFKVNAKYDTKTTVLGATVKTSSEPDVKSVDFSIPVGISYEYANFQLDARYNWGLTKIAKHGDDKNSVFQITLGYKFGPINTATLCQTHIGTRKQTHIKDWHYA